MSGALVYRAYDAAGRLLYVGVTTHLGKRVRAHRASSEWWPLVDRLESDPPLGDVHAARQSERAQIYRLRPLHNKMGNYNRGWYYGPGGCLMRHADGETHQASDRREALGLTQEKLASALDVSVRTVQRWERGADVPRRKHRLRLAKVLQIEDPAELYPETKAAA